MLDKLVVEHTIPQNKCNQAQGTIAPNWIENSAVNTICTSNAGTCDQPGPSQPTIHPSIHCNCTFQRWSRVARTAIIHQFTMAWSPLNSPTPYTPIYWSFTATIWASFTTQDEHTLYGHAWKLNIVGYTHTHSNEQLTNNGPSHIEQDAHHCPGPSQGNTLDHKFFMHA